MNEEKSVANSVRPLLHSLISNLWPNMTSHQQIVTSSKIWGYVTRICREHLETSTVHRLFMLKRIVAFQC